MSVRNISIEAYHRHLDSGAALTQWAKIYRFLEQHDEGFTRSELSERLRIRLSSVCGRVNELMRANMIEEAARRRCHVTSEPAHPVRIPPRMQGRLF